MASEQSSSIIYRAVTPAPHGKGRLPDFYVIGAAKCGTTTLWEYLRASDAIFMSRLKEPEFFSNEKVWRRGLDWYAKLWEDARPDQLCGEASTTYTRWPHTLDSASLIYNCTPDARLIYLVRHPVDRVYSHYCHQLRLIGYSGGLLENIRRDPTIIDSSRYDVQIERYLQLFSFKRIHVMLLEDLIADRVRTLQRLAAFLELDDKAILTNNVVVSNARNTYGVDDYIRRRTVHRLTQLPGGWRLYYLIPPSVRSRTFSVFRRSPIGNAIAKCYQPEPLSTELRGYLLSELRASTEIFLHIIQRDQPSWFL